MARFADANRRYDYNWFKNINMKNALYFLTAVAFGLFSCAENVSVNKAEKPSEIHPVSRAYGYDNWENIERLGFTFNVEKQKKRKTKIRSRSWIWFPKTDTVIYMNEYDTLTYYRKGELGPLEVNADQLFINDRYWLLCPFNLSWDEGINFSEEKEKQGPISGDSLYMQTIVYDSEVGYTPGDAYDLYYDKNHIVKEWVFRRSNAEEPTLITTWEENIEIEDMLFSTEHYNTDSTFHLYFTDIEVN